MRAQLKRLVMVTAGAAGRMLFPGLGGVKALPFLVRWARARGRAVASRRGVLRGTAIVWPEPARAWVVGVDVPRPPRGRVLVRLVASVVSAGTERAFFTGLPNAIASFPAFPGYSGAGVVEEVGRGVTALRPGDRVAIVAPHASVALLPVERVHLVPDGVSLEEAAFVQLGVIALHALRVARLWPGGSVIVLGHGIIGQLLTQLVAAFGAGSVTTVARTAARVTAALRRSADRVVILERDGAGAVGEADVTLEATGAPETLPLAIACTRPGGVVVLAGSPRGVTPAVDFGALADKALTIVGAHITGLAEDTAASLAGTFLALLQSRRIDVTALISTRIHPWEAEHFYRRLAARGDVTVGALFRWDQLPSAEQIRPVSFLTPPDLGPLRHAVPVLLPPSRRVGMAREAVVAE